MNPAKHDVEFVVTCPHAAIPLEPAEQAFHFVAVGIQSAVEGPKFPACRAGWHHGRGSQVLHHPLRPVVFIRTIHNHILRMLQIALLK